MVRYAGPLRRRSRAARPSLRVDRLSSSVTTSLDGWSPPRDASLGHRTRLIPRLVRRPLIESECAYPVKAFLLHSAMPARHLGQPDVCGYRQGGCARRKTAPRSSTAEKRGALALHMDLNIRHGHPSAPHPHRPGGHRRTGSDAVAALTAAADTGSRSRYMSIENNPCSKTDSACHKTMAGRRAAISIGFESASFRRGGLRCAPLHRPLSWTSGP